MKYSRKLNEGYTKISSFFRVIEIILKIYLGNLDRITILLIYVYLILRIFSIEYFLENFGGFFKYLIE